MEANKETDGCRLKDLPGFLIGQVWPRERVVMGLKVSKWLREEIHANAEAVLFSAAKGLGHSPDAFETSDIRSDLNKFSSSTKVYVSVDNVTAFKVSKILDAIVKTFSPEPQSILPICSSPPPKPESTLGHCLAGLCMDRLGGGDGEILPFLTALQHCSAMEEVAIREFWIGDDGREYLAKAIASFRELKCLDLQLYLGDEGAEQLAQALVSCTALQQLTLQHNHIQDRGLEVLFGALGNCRRLHHVDLQHNMLGLSGAVAIGTLLAHCSHLQLLDLSHTKLDDELASALLLNLQLDAPRSLQHFRLRCNNFTSATVAELAAITWPALQTLDLEENQATSAVGPRTCSALSDADEALCMCFGLAWRLAWHAMSDMHTDISRRSCQVGDEGATVLASALHRSYPPIVRMIHVLCSVLFHKLSCAASQIVECWFTDCPASF